MWKEGWPQPGEEEKGNNRDEVKERHKDLDVVVYASKITKLP